MSLNTTLLEETVSYLYIYIFPVIFQNFIMSKITHIGRNFSDMKSGSKKLRELFPGMVPVPKCIVENTPANKVPAPSVAAPKKTEAGPTLKPRGTKAASKDIEPAVVVIPIQNMKESKKALVKAADNLAAQVQCVQPIWTRKPDDIEQGEYDELYKSRRFREDGSRPSQKRKTLVSDKVTEYMMTKTRSSPCPSMRPPTL
jgi:hypothetical protein